MSATRAGPRTPPAPGRGPTRVAERSALGPRGPRAAGRSGRSPRVPRDSPARGPKRVMRCRRWPSPEFLLLPAGTRLLQIGSPPSLSWREVATSAPYHQRPGLSPASGSLAGIQEPLLPAPGDPVYLRQAAWERALGARQVQVRGAPSPRGLSSETPTRQLDKGSATLSQTDSPSADPV